MKRCVLLASHGGDSANGAVRVAPLVAERLGVELAVAAAIPPVPAIDYGYGIAFAAGDGVDAELEERLRDDVAQQFLRVGAAARDVSILHGAPAIELAAAARMSQASILVVGLGPHQAIDRALGGETALQLVQVASTPVLAVPAAAASLPRVAVAAIDFTPSSVWAARTAATLLARGDSLHLVHVRPHGDHGGANAPRGRPSGPSASPEAALARVAARLERPDLEIDCVILEGAPARTLLDHGKTAHADMIALGSHGYGQWKRLTIGSVASKVLRLASTFVLVQPIGSVPTPGADKP